MVPAPVLTMPSVPEMSPVCCAEPAPVLFSTVLGVVTTGSALTSLSA